MPVLRLSDGSAKVTVTIHQDFDITFPPEAVLDNISDFELESIAKAEAFREFMTNYDLNKLKNKLIPYYSALKDTTTSWSNSNLL